MYFAYYIARRALRGGVMQKRNNKNNTLIYIFGVIYALSAFILRIYCKSPYSFLHKTGAYSIFPPFWLFSLLYIAACFFGGCYLGRAVLKGFSKCIPDSERADVYKGGILFSILFFLSLIWYPTLFLNEGIVLGFFIALICFILSISLISIWSKSLNIKLDCILFCIWWFYVSVLCFILIFKI